MKKQIKDKETKAVTTVERFDSVTAFWAGIKDKAAQPAFAGYEASQQISDFRDDFTGTHTFEEATGLLLEGDRQNADKVLRAVMAIKRQVGKETKRQRVGTGVVGFAPNVPNFLAGVPRNMITATPSKRKDKIINLIYDTTAPADTDKEVLQRAVINIAGAIVALEAGGARVNVYATFSVESKKHKSGVFIKVKNACQPLDVLKMIYPLGHPSMMRRHLFRWLEVTPMAKSFRHGYGTCMTASQCGQLAQNADIKCDRVMNYSTASDNDYKALARMIDTGVII